MNELIKHDCEIFDLVAEELARMTGEPLQRAINYLYELAEDEDIRYDEFTLNELAANFDEGKPLIKR